MYGVDILKLYDQQINQAYAQNEGTDRKQIRINRALRTLVDRLIAKEDSQVEFDQLSHVSFANESYTPFEGKIHLGLNPIKTVEQINPTQIKITTEYETLAAVNDLVSIESEDPSGFTGSFTVAAVVNAYSYLVAATPTLPYAEFGSTMSIATKYVTRYMRLKRANVWTYDKIGFIGALVKFLVCGPENQIIFKTPTKLRTGNFIVISGTGITGLDGYHYVRTHGIRGIGLYQDRDLLSPSSFAASTWPSSGQIKLINDVGATVLVSDQKISPFQTPDPNFPQVEFSRKMLVITPPEAMKVVVDYDGINFVYFNVRSTTVNYTNFYTPKFIDKVVTMAAISFLDDNSDLEHSNFKSQNEVVLNP